MAVFGQVDGADLGLAGVTGFDADVGELLGYVDGQFLFVFFAACVAIDSAKIPFL